MLSSEISIYIQREFLGDQVTVQPDGYYDAEEVLDSGQSLVEDVDLQVLHTSHNSLERPETVEMMI